MHKIVLLTLLCSFSLAAQSRGSFYIGGGPTFPQARLNDYLDKGYNISVGAGVKANSVIELLGEFDFFGQGVESSVLRALTVPQGSSRVYSVTGNLKLNLIPGPVNLYVIGGGGWYRRTVEFTEPTTAVITVFDPFFGFFGNALVPANQVLGSTTRDAGGFNAGAGLAFSVGGGVKIYAESRWHRAYHSPVNTTLLPITFGLRF